MCWTSVSMQMLLLADAALGGGQPAVAIRNYEVVQLQINK
jgi:hypothetical protein